MVINCNFHGYIRHIPFRDAPGRPVDQLLFLPYGPKCPIFGPKIGPIRPKLPFCCYISYISRFWTNLRAKNRAFWAIGQKQKLVHGSPRGVPKWDLSDIAIRITIDHHYGDITQYKSLLQYGEPHFWPVKACH